MESKTMETKESCVDELELKPYGQVHIDFYIGDAGFWGSRVLKPS